MVPDASQTGSGSLPKHERLRTHLLRELSEGRLRPGEALPTELELASSAGMSRNTVRQALSALERSGLIRRVRGRGTFVHESAPVRLKSGLDIFALAIPETRGGFYPSLQRGFHNAAAALHNQTIVCDTTNDPFRQADALLQLMDQQVAGIALVPTTLPPTPPHQLRPLRERGIPLVFCHRRVDGINAPLVTFSALDVGRLAGQAMIEHGHRRVAFVGTQRAGLGPRYEEGLRRALRAAGCDLPAAFVRYGNTRFIDSQHEQFLERTLGEFMRMAHRPTAVMSGFDSEAEMIYLILSRMGVRVPGDMSIVGFGGAWREGAITRLLTSVVVDEEALGRKAVELLNEMRHRQRPLDDTTEILMPLGLSGGETLGPAPRDLRPARRPRRPARPPARSPSFSRAKA